MTNPTGSSEINLAAPQQPAPDSLSDTPNGYAATIGPNAARILAEIEAANNTNTPPNTLQRLCIVFGCAGAVVICIWGLIEVNPATKRRVDSKTTSVSAFQISQDACRLSGGQNTWWP